MRIKANRHPIKAVQTAEEAEVAPTKTNDCTEGYEIHSTWCMEDGTVYYCTCCDEGAAVWKEMGGGGGSDEPDEPEEQPKAIVPSAYFSEPLATLRPLIEISSHGVTITNDGTAIASADIDPTTRIVLRGFFNTGAKETLMRLHVGSVLCIQNRFATSGQVWHELNGRIKAGQTLSLRFWADNDIHMDQAYLTVEVG